MAHFAELDENNVVQRVIVVSDKNTSDEDGNEDENIGIAFCKKLHGSDSIWKQCSYNALIRKSFPARGFTYSETLDAFIHPQPYSSWTLSDDGCWLAPIEEPELTSEQVRLGYYYSWNDGIYQADSNEPKTLGWVLFTPQIITITQQPVDVTVSTGSSVTFTGSATVSKGVLGWGLQKQNAEGEFFPVTEYYTTGELSVNAFCNIGIVTSGDNGSKYRLEFAPYENGVIGYSTTVTLTVT
tara:strand:- start:507 stop:1226 length:720 start_codon:yes stop_codon:yes gene_type:complete